MIRCPSGKRLSIGGNTSRDECVAPRMPVTDLAGKPAEGNWLRKTQQQRHAPRPGTLEKPFDRSPTLLHPGWSRRNIHNLYPWWNMLQNYECGRGRRLDGQLYAHDISVSGKIPAGYISLCPGRPSNGEKNEQLCNIPADIFHAFTLYSREWSCSECLGRKDRARASQVYPPASQSSSIAAKWLRFSPGTEKVSKASRISLSLIT